MVDLWAVVLGYAFVLLLIQVAVYLYLSDGRGGGGRDRAVPTGAGGDARSSVEERSRSRDYRRCPHCGAANESDAPFEFCRECIGSLQG